MNEFFTTYGEPQKVPTIDELRRLMQQIEMQKMVEGLENRLLFSSLIPHFCIGVPYGHTLCIKKKQEFPEYSPLELEIPKPDYSFLGFVPMTTDWTTV
jgi:hypothetical protein